MYSDRCIRSLFECNLSYCVSFMREWDINIEDVTRIRIVNQMCFYAYLFKFGIRYAFILADVSIALSIEWLRV